MAQLAWLAKSIIKRNLQKLFSKPKLKYLKRLAIDEISVSKGRKLFHEVKDIFEKKVLKGSRWLLLKNPENLNEEHNEKHNEKQMFAGVLEFFKLRMMAIHKAKYALTG